MVDPQMTAPKSSRKVLGELKRLMGPRVTPEDSLDDVFPFGTIPPGLLVGKGTARTYDDRAIVLITATVIEQSLETALLRQFVALSADDLFSADGAPLSTFSAKVALGFALGLFGRAAKADLTMIRHIRNAFAHSRLTIDFGTPEIAAACGQLRTPGVITSPTWGDPRERFISLGSDLAVYLTTTNRFDDKHRAKLRAKALDLPLGEFRAG